MSRRIHFSMQTYRRDAHGDFAKGRWRACSSADEARRAAEAVVMAAKASGAVALSQCTSGEYDDGEKPITIAAYGDVPRDADDVIPF